MDKSASGTVGKSIWLGHERSMKSFVFSESPPRASTNIGIILGLGRHLNIHGQSVHNSCSAAPHSPSHLPLKERFVGERSPRLTIYNSPQTTERQQSKQLHSETLRRRYLPSINDSSNVRKDILPEIGTRLSVKDIISVFSSPRHSVSKDSKHSSALLNYHAHTQPKSGNPKKHCIRRRPVHKHEALRQPNTSVGSQIASELIEMPRHDSRPRPTVDTNTAELQCAALRPHASVRRYAGPQRSRMKAIHESVQSSRVLPTEPRILQPCSNSSTANEDIVEGLFRQSKPRVATQPQTSFLQPITPGSIVVKRKPILP